MRSCSLKIPKVIVDLTIIEFCKGSRLSHGEKVMIIEDIVHEGSPILGLQPCDKAAMLGVKRIEFFMEEFT